MPPEATPGSAGGASATNARRAWLRSARFLYDTQVTHLLDSPADRERRLADLLGVGPIVRQREMAEKWSDLLARRRRELGKELELASAGVDREREALRALEPHDPAALRAALDAIEGPPPTRKSLASRATEAREAIAELSARITRLMALETALTEAPDLAAAHERAELAELLQHAVELAALTDDADLLTLRDRHGELDEPVDLRKLRADYTVAELRERADAARVARDALDPVDLPTLEADVARTKEAADLADAALAERARPLEQLRAAVDAMLDDLDRSDCPACGHPWGDAAALAEALRNGAAPLADTVQQLQQDADDTQEAHRAARAALRAGRARAAERDQLDDERTRVTRRLARWRRAVLGAAIEGLEELSGAATLDPHLDVDRTPSELVAALAGHLGTPPDDVLGARAQAESARLAATDTWRRLTVDWRHDVGGGKPTVAGARAALDSLRQAESDAHDQLAKLEEARRLVNLEARHAQLAATLPDLQEELDARQVVLERLDAAMASADADVARLAEQARAVAKQSFDALHTSINGIFRRMQANPVVTDVQLSLDGGLSVRVGDSDLDPFHQLSRGQRQDLALAIFLARAHALGGTFFLDEPFTHLDDLNRTAVLDLLRAITLQSAGKVRLVITTASETLARHIQAKFARVPTPDALRILELSGGPTVGLSVATRPATRGR